MSELFSCCAKPQSMPLERVLDAIREQARALRDLKGSEGTSQERLNDEVWRLLHLKFLYCSASPEPVTDPDLLVATSPAPRIKIRWVVAEPAGERGQRNEVVRYQRTFEGRTFVSGREVLDAIQEQMRRKYGVKCGVILLERIARHVVEEEPAVEERAAKQKEQKAPDVDDKSATEGDKKKSTPVKSKWAGRKKKNLRADLPVTKTYSCVHESDMFRLPLVMPGPVLASETVVNLLVTFVPLHLPAQCTPPQYRSLNSLPLLIDCGCNLFDKQLQDTSALIDRALEAGVQQISLLSTNVANAKWNIELCNYRSGTLFTSVGVHPHEAAKMTVEEVPLVAEALEELVRENRQHVKAIGEVGLDMSHGTESAAVQEAFFRAQLQLALKLHLPVVLHEREAHEPFSRILQEFSGKLPAMLVNCFTGDAAALQHYLDAGAHIGITGIVANVDRGAHLPELLGSIPSDRLVLGTDAPYMTPFNMPPPYPRYNSPALLPFVLVKVAEVLGRDPLELAMQTTANAQKLFALERVLSDASLGPTHACVADIVPFRTAPRHYYGPAHMHPRSTKKVPPPSAESSRPGDEAATSAASSGGGPRVDAESNSSAPACNGGAAPVKKSGDAGEAVNGAPTPVVPEPSGDAKLFAWKGVYYECSEKELQILHKQKRLLPEAAFAALVQDFDLKRVDTT